MSKQDWWIDIDRGKNEVSKQKKCPSANFTSKFHMVLPET